MKYLIEYRMAYTDYFITCSSQEEALEFARQCKTMGAKYVYINEIKYRIDLTEQI